MNEELITHQILPWEAESSPDDQVNFILSRNHLHYPLLVIRYYQSDYVKDDMIRVINETVNAYITVVAKPEEHTWKIWQ